jgi:hypothetical protein
VLDFKIYPPKKIQQFYGDVVGNKNATSMERSKKYENEPGFE